MKHILPQKAYADDTNLLYNSFKTKDKMSKRIAISRFSEFRSMPEINSKIDELIYAQTKQRENRSYVSCIKKWH